MTRLPFVTLIRVDSQLTLRVTHEGAIKAEFPITEANAALVVAEGALFIRDQFIEQATQQSKK